MRREPYVPFGVRVESILAMAKRAPVYVAVAKHTIYAFPSTSALVNDLKRMPNVNQLGIFDKKTTREKLADAIFLAMKR